MPTYNTIENNTNYDIKAYARRSILTSSRSSDNKTFYRILELSVDSYLFTQFDGT